MSVDSMRWRGLLPPGEVAGRCCADCSEWEASLPLERLRVAKRQLHVEALVGLQHPQTPARSVAESNF